MARIRPLPFPVLTDRPRVVKVMDNIRRTTLRVDAIFLALAGVFGLVGDLMSYRYGRGPFGTTFHENPVVIGVVEAHSLAMLIAAALWHSSRTREGSFGNWIGLSAHLVLGGCNILWFEVFTRVGAEAQGMAVTVVHFVFAALNGFLIIRSTTREQRVR